MGCKQMGYQKKEPFTDHRSQRFGLWWHPEIMCYTSSGIDISELRQFKGRVRIIAQKNRAKTKGDNRPSLVFRIYSADYAAAERTRFQSPRPFIRVDDAVEIARRCLNDMQLGYSYDDLSVEVERFMQDRAVLFYENEEVRDDAE